MQKNLVIVESPAKARTIEKFLGKDYKVMSSFGHIRDLKEKEFSIDITHDFAPIYVIPPEKTKLVSALKTAAQDAKQVLLASDEDREGEAIAWHLAEALMLDPKNTQRIVFHEITKNAIIHAIENPRPINIDLVNAQQARRVLDRIVGFELSPVLWRKVKPALSAGRVQSVAVRLIVDREREILQFEAEASFRMTASFILSDGTTLLKAELNRRLKDISEVNDFLKQMIARSFSVDEITTKPFKKSPAPPFTTSTLQQDAARKLGFSVSQTMMVAQRLYESGHITYMRTDSVNLSDLALNTSKETIIKTYGEKYHHYRTYRTKSKGAQEAHEAIRPTYMNKPEIQGTAQEKKLYELIYKRTIACQMADAELERTTISVAIEGLKEKFITTGEVITFDGFLHVYMESQDEDAEKEQGTGLLPAVGLNEKLDLQEITAAERFTQRPVRYNEAGLVRRLEELGIGRPSTYAPTIQTIQNRRGYVVKGDKPGEERSYQTVTLTNGKITSAQKSEMVGVERNKLIPTDIGTVVNDFLLEFFPDILDYNFTANVEKNFDAVAEGQLDWTKALDQFYRFFHPIVEAASAVKTARKVGERLVGKEPKSGEPVYVKIGRYGPIAQIGEGHPEDKEAPKPRFASLMKSQSIETITLEEVMKLFDLPRTIGEYEGKEMTAGIGRFGPFVRHNNIYIAIPKNLNPMQITPEETIRLIEEKRKKQSQRHIKTFVEEPGLEILNGRYGAYISFNGKNYRIPKNVVPAEMTLEECRKIIES